MKATMAIYSVVSLSMAAKTSVQRALVFKPFPFFDFLVFVVVVCTSSPVSFITMQIDA